MATTPRDRSATRTLLEPGNELAAFCREEQGRQRRVARIVGMSDSQLSLAIRGRRWLSRAELSAIRGAVSRLRRDAARKAGA